MAADTFRLQIVNDAGTVLQTFDVPQNKLDATGAPGVTDDDAAGYVGGSLWVDRTNDKVYVCQDNATGAAVWAQIAGAGGSYQPLDATLTALAGLTIAANSLTVGTGADAFSQVTFAANTFPARASTGDLVAKTITDFALTILDDADAAAVRATIGAGTGAGTVTSVNLTAPAAGITVSGGPITTSGSITLALADDLAALEALAGTSTIYYRSGANTWSAVTVGAGLTFSGGTLYAHETRNLLANGEPWLAQRVDPTAATAMTDDAYNCFDRWYSLIQGANPTVTRLAGLDGTQYMGRMTAGGTTNRFGLAMILEAGESIPLRGRAVTFQGRFLQSNAALGTQNVRMAILEWTGSADAVTSDVVNDWTSVSYTLGNFFASSNLVLCATAGANLVYNTWTTHSVTGTVGSSCNNLILFFFWAEQPGNAGDYLNFCKLGLFDGSSVRDWLPADRGADLARCQRYYQKSYAIDTAPGTSTTTGVIQCAVPSNTIAAGDGYNSVVYPVRMRASPTSTFYGAGGTAGVVSNNAGTDLAADTCHISFQSESSFACFANAGTTTAGKLVIYHFTSGAEL